MPGGRTLPLSSGYRSKRMACMFDLSGCKVQHTCVSVAFSPPEMFLTEKKGKRIQHKKAVKQHIKGRALSTSTSVSPLLL